MVNGTTLWTDSDKEYNAQIWHPNYLFHNKIYKKISFHNFYTHRILPEELKNMKHWNVKSVSLDAQFLSTSSVLTVVS
jgi:hypothetical protein